MKNRCLHAGRRCVVLLLFAIVACMVQHCLADVSISATTAREDWFARHYASASNSISPGWDAIKVRYLDVGAITTPAPTTEKEAEEEHHDEHYDEEHHVVDQHAGIHHDENEDHDVEHKVVEHKSLQEENSEHAHGHERDQVDHGEFGVANIINEHEHEQENVHETDNEHENDHEHGNVHENDHDHENMHEIELEHDHKKSEKDEAAEATDGIPDDQLEHEHEAVADAHPNEHEAHGNVEEKHEEQAKTGDVSVDVGHSDGDSKEIGLNNAEGTVHGEKQKEMHPHLGGLLGVQTVNRLRPDDELYTYSYGLANLRALFVLSGLGFLGYKYRRELREWLRKKAPLMRRCWSAVVTQSGKLNGLRKQIKASATAKTQSQKAAMKRSASMQGGHLRNIDGGMEMRVFSGMTAFTPKRTGLSVKPHAVALLSDEMIQQIKPYLPKTLHFKDWRLQFSSDLHGYNLQAAYRRCATSPGPFLLVVMDTARYVFGAFSPVALARSSSYYGTGESFLLRIRPDFGVSGWTGSNSHILLSNEQCLAWGGGGGFALWLDENFERGTSEPNCPTFNNPCLASSESFKCVAVEIWGFETPKLR